MNRDCFDRVAANLLGGLAFASTACLVVLANNTAVGQSLNDFAAPARAKTIEPSQNDATFTPDPYYSPEIALDAPLSSDEGTISEWEPPSSPSLPSRPQAQPVAKTQKTVRSLMEQETWEPPRTPVAPGYEPRQLSHSPIPWLQQPSRASQAQQTPIGLAGPTSSSTAGIENSIIRPKTISPVASDTNRMISNSFAVDGKKIAGDPEPAPSQTLAPALNITRPDATKSSPESLSSSRTKKRTQEYTTRSEIALRSKKTKPPAEKLATKTKPSAKQSSTSKPLSSFEQGSNFKPLASSKPAPSSKLRSSSKQASSSKDGSSTKRTNRSALASKPAAVKSRPKRTASATPAAKTTRIRAGAKPAGAETFEPSQLLALVGGEPIFVGDALLEVNQLIEQHMGAAPESAKARERRGLIKRILPKLVDEKMLYVGALQELPEEADVDKIVESAAKEFDSKALPDLLKRAKVKDAGDYDAMLRKMGSSLRKRRDAWAREQMTRYFISQQLNLNQEITHQQLLDEYRSNVEDYKIAEKAKWEQIMVRFDRFDSRDEARGEIVELGNRIVHGASLAALAKKSSHGFRADKGGQHDWTGRDALVLKEIDKAIFTLPIGKLSDVIETRDGLHIVRVVDRQEAGIKPFTEAQTKIKKRLKVKMREDAFQKHIAKLKERIPVEYFTLESNDVASRENGSLLE